MTSLLHNWPKSLSWTPTATETFQQLKETFCTIPILKHPNPDLPFVVEVDKSNNGVEQSYLSSRWNQLRSIHVPSVFVEL